MDKDYIRYLQKVKNSKNVYNATRMRLRKKLGKSSDDCEHSNNEIMQLFKKLPNKSISNISIELFNNNIIESKNIDTIVAIQEQINKSIVLNTKISYT